MKTATSPPAPSPRGGEGRTTKAACGRRGFTFVELVVVWAIIAILAAILFPVFARAREKARQCTCSSNLRNISAALRIYGAEHCGHLPPGDNAVTVLYPRYLAEAGVFKCPTVGDRRIIPYPPTPPPGGESSMKHPPDAPASAPPAMPPGSEYIPEDTGILIPGLTFDYVYRGGLCDDDLPNQAVMADDRPGRHNDGANVLMLGGSVKWYNSNPGRSSGSSDYENKLELLRPVEEMRRIKSIQAGAHPPELPPPPPKPNYRPGKKAKEPKDE